jgi:archaemetzincin
VSAFYVAAVGAVRPSAMQAVCDCLAAAFPLPVRLLPPQPDPDFAFDAARRQHSASLVLQRLLAACPPDAHRLLGITERDLFIPMLSFVFGLAQLRGQVAVVSLSRLRQEFYGLPPDPEACLDRTRKEVLHESGHTFGLVHCRDPRCVMTVSSTVHQLDAKGGDFCGTCALLLRDTVARVQVNGAGG